MQSRYRQRMFRHGDINDWIELAAARVGVVSSCASFIGPNDRYMIPVTIVAATLKVVDRTLEHLTLQEYCCWSGEDAIDRLMEEEASPG